MITAIIWILGISFILMLLIIAYKAAVEDGSYGCLISLVLAIIITIIALATR